MEETLSGRGSVWVTEPSLNFKLNGLEGRPCNTCDKEISCEVECPSFIRWYLESINKVKPKGHTTTEVLHEFPQLTKKKLKSMQNSKAVPYTIWGNLAIYTDIQAIRDYLYVPNLMTTKQFLIKTGIKLTKLKYLISMGKLRPAEKIRGVNYWSEKEVLCAY